MDRKNLNWVCPEPITTEFERVVTEHCGVKGKWMGATAAMLMYLESPEEIQRDYERKARELKFGEDPADLLAEAERIKAKRAKPPHGKRAPKAHGMPPKGQRS